MKREMDFQDFIVDVFGPYRDANPTQRTGQALFNSLWRVRPELARVLQNDSGCDPFYLEDDDREYAGKITDAMVFIARNWEVTP